MHRSQKGKKIARVGFEPRTSCIALFCLNHFASSVHANYISVQDNNTVLPGGWWRTSGAGPAPPPAPAMTSPGRASTWISLKPRSAAKQALEPLMCRRTPDRWRKSPRLERRPVAVQVTQTKRVTAVGPYGVTVTGGGPATGPAMDAIATAKR